MTTMTAQNFAEIHAEAHAAGMAAGQGAVPVPMTVFEAEPLTGAPTPGGKNWYVSEGACGFAWVSFAGNTAWARWAKKAGIARSHYPSGLHVWIGHFNQSIARKEAYAHAYAKVLNAHGITAYPGSRLD